MADFYQRVGAEFYVRDRSAQGVRGFLNNMNRVRRDVTSIQRTLSTAFGLGFGYLGLRGLIQGVKSVTAAAMEQEKAERQLAAAVGWTNEVRATAMLNSAKVRLQSTNSSVVRAARRDLQRIISRYPKTKAAEEAKKIDDALDKSRRR